MRWKPVARTADRLAGAALGLAVAASPVPAAAQSARRRASPATTITVGGVAGVTNPVGQPYASGFDGVQAYFNYINGKGGVFGRSSSSSPSSTTSPAPRRTSRRSGRSSRRRRSSRSCRS